MKIEKGCFIIMGKAGSSLSQMTDDTNDVYDWVSCIAAVPEAVKASSWCELAAVDDVYLGDGFTLAIVDVERGTRNVSAQQ